MGGGKFLDAVEAALMGGVKAIQLREKDLSDYELVELGKKTTSPHIQLWSSALHQLASRYRRTNRR